MKNLSKNEKEIISDDTLHDLGDLKPQEIELIYLIRNQYRFGKVVIETRDGLPQNLLQTVERVRLGDFSKMSTD